jgi:predicted ATPase
MLTKLKVKNYKSLADVEIDFHHFNVLIGPNNSGKSNILDCLAFLADTVTMSVEDALRKRGGYDHVVFGGHVEKTIKIDVITTEKSVKKEYDVTFTDKGVNKEKLIITKNGETNVHIDGIEGKGFFFDEIANAQMEYSFSPVFTALLNFRDLKRQRTIVDFKDELLRWRFYHFVPFEMRGAFSVEKRFDPGYKGEEAVRTLHSLLSEHLNFFSEIENSLRSAIEEIENLRSPLTREGKTYIAIKEKHFRDHFDYYQVSDGTLRFLAHLLVLLSPPSEAPMLACFEEPENFVHPRLLELLAEILKKTKTQVIVTTHSPYFIDFVELEDLIVIEKEEGKTVPKRLERKELEKFLKDFSLGELWYTGRIGGVP